MVQLNTTGSLWKDNEGNYYSYSTQLTGTYKELRVFNNTFYSMTTRKHQTFVKSVEGKFDIELTRCNYGNLDTEEAIKNEIIDIDYNLGNLSEKRNTRKKQETIKDLNNRKEFFVNLLNK